MKVINKINVHNRQIRPREHPSEEDILSVFDYKERGLKVIKCILIKWILRIFFINLLCSFRPNRNRNSKYLRILKLELESLRQRPNLFDSIISEKLNSMGASNTLSYLCESYLAAETESEKAINKEKGVQQFIALTKEMLMNYSMLFIGTPQLFEKHTPDISQCGSSEEAVALTLHHLFELNGYSGSFMTALNNNFHENEPQLFKEVYRGVLMILADKMKESNPHQHHSLDLLTLFIKLIADQRIKALITDVPRFPWVPSATGMFSNSKVGGDDLQFNSFLGQFFGKSLLPVTMDKEPKPQFLKRMSTTLQEMKSARSRTAQMKVIQKFRDRSFKYGEDLGSLMIALLKTKNTDIKEKVLQFLGLTVSTNISRTKLGADLAAYHKFSMMLQKVSSDGFMLNALYALLRLCKPFLNKDDGRLLKIDPSYLMSNFRFSIENETPACKHVSETPVKASATFGTITQFFFLALEVFHFGYSPALNRLQKLAKYHRNLVEEKKKIAPGHPKELQIKRMIESLTSIKLAYELVLVDPVFHRELANLFYIFFLMVQKWGNLNPKTYSLQQDPPAPIMNKLPEHIFFDFASHYEFMLTNARNGLVEFQDQHLIAVFECFVLLMRSQEAVTNPFSRIEFLKPIYAILNLDKNNNFKEGKLKNSEVVKDYLIEVILHLYMEVEHTGSINQFYQKYHHRHLMALILVELWKVTFFKKATYALREEPIFEKFINNMVNDTLWCLDEGMQRVHEIKKKKANKAALSQEELKEYNQDKGTARSVFSIANVSMVVIKSISSWGPDLFYFKGIAEATAQMLNFIILALVGPKNLANEIQEPEKYSFKPIELLKDVTEILTNLGAQNEEFSMLVVKDERSYDNQCLQKSARLLRKNGKLSAIRAFQLYIKKLQELSSSAQDLDDILTNPPDEFICPLSYDIMKDPVLLPTSGKICERSWMQRVLLNDDADPFNRKPLSGKDLQPAVELKARIDHWIKQKMEGVEETDEDLRMKKEEAEAQQTQEKEEDEAKEDEFYAPQEKSAFEEEEEEEAARVENTNLYQEPQFGGEIDEDMMRAIEMSMLENNKK